SISLHDALPIFYNDEGTPISRLLFGIDRANAVAVICEGAIDALSWETAGYSALAVGGAHMSREQFELIKRSPIKRLYLGGDSDKQGAKMDAQVEEELRGYVEMITLEYGKEKDANEALLLQGVGGLRSILNRASPIRAIQIHV